jgi:hypothetical protein
MDILEACLRWKKSVNIKTIKRRMLRTGNAVLGADTFQGILILGV